MFKLCLSCTLYSDLPTFAIYLLSLHDALPISPRVCEISSRTRRRQPLRSSSSTSSMRSAARARRASRASAAATTRSEEHTSELQSHSDLVCRLLLEKKNRQQSITELRSADK